MVKKKTCKQKLHPKLTGKETLKESYQKAFNQSVLDQACKSVEPLNRVIQLISDRSS